MGAVHIYATFTGPKGKKKAYALVDTGATYSLIPKDVAEAIGIKATGTYELEGPDGKLHRYRGAAVLVSIGDRSGPTTVLVNTVDEAIIGFETLEVLGYKVDPKKGIVEPTLPWKLRI